MAKGIKNVLTSFALSTACLGVSQNIVDAKTDKTYKPKEQKVYKEPRCLNERERQQKKAHKKKIKARKNTKKGIYQNKIKYKKERK